MHTEYASILLDMIVAYERVPHHWLARHGMQFGFNMHLLLLSVAVDRLGEVVRVAGTYPTIL